MKNVSNLSNSVIHSNILQYFLISPTSKTGNTEIHITVAICQSNPSLFIRNAVMAFLCSYVEMLV